MWLNKLEVVSLSAYYVTRLLFDQNNAMACFTHESFTMKKTQLTKFELDAFQVVPTVSLLQKYREFSCLSPLSLSQR